MYPTHFAVRRAPSHGCRAIRNAPGLARQLSGGPGFFPSAPFWGTMGARNHPFFGGGRGRDVFDHFDDFVTRSFDNILTPAHSNRARGSSEQFTWQPRFDVSEVDNVYQLRGELPGVEPKDIGVEFTDANTLVVRGKTETERTEGTPAEQRQDNDAVMNGSETVTQAAAESTAPQQDSDAASVHSESSYVKPSVEDEADATARENGTETSSTPAADNTVTAQRPDQSKQAETQPNQPRYWVSERSIGSFQRTFSFPNRVDSEGVSASLKNGILDIVVPKAKAPEARKIQIQ